jgi:hypothetical protein
MNSSACTLNVTLGTLVMAWLLTSCGGSSDLASAAPTTDGRQLTDLAGLGPPSALAVLPPPDAGRFLTGDETDFQLPLSNVFFAPSGIELLPDWDGITLTDPAGLAYAGYSFSLSGFGGPPCLQLSWRVPPADGDAWLALAEWERDRWEWHSLPPAAGLELPGLEPYINAEGNLSVLVLVTGTSLCELAWLRVGDNLGPLAKAGATASIAVRGQPCTLNGSASIDFDGSIAAYEWDTDGDGEYDLSAGGAGSVDHVFETAGSRTVGLRVTDDAGATDVASTGILVSDGLRDTADFESGWQGWAGDVADVLVSPGDEIYWELDRSTDLAFSGDWSVWLTADNRTDACKLWVEKRYELAPDTTYTASISYRFATEIGGIIGTWTILAGAMNTDPETGYDIFQAGLARETTYNGGVSGFTWLSKTYTMDLTTDGSGEVYMLAGVWGVFEVWQTYYLDDLIVQIIPAQ